MKKLVLSVLAGFMFLSSMALAKAGDKAPIEVIEVEGQSLVMIPADLAATIDHLAKSNLSTEDKLTSIRAVIHRLGTDDSAGSYCATIGEVNKTENSDAAKMTAKCVNTLHNGENDFLNEVPTDYKTVDELRMQFSEALTFLITSSF